MSIETIDEYGAPSYGPLCYNPANTRAGLIEGQAIHTPENPSIYLSSAIAIARWQASAGNTSGGSYHGILACKDGADPELRSSWVLVRSVTWDQAAGGLSGNHSAPNWAPDRFTWIRANMAPTAFADPNAFLHQVAWSGQTAWYVQNGIPLGLLQAHAELTVVLEDAYNYDALLTLHRHWQLDRSDPGNLDSADLLLDEYLKIRNPEPTPEPTPLPTPRYSDVPFDHQFHKEIEWMATEGITQGIGGGKYGPDLNVTRGQLAAFLYRATSGDRVSALRHMAATGEDARKSITAVKGQLVDRLPMRLGTPTGPKDPESKVPTEEELEQFTPDYREITRIMGSLRPVEN